MFNYWAFINALYADEFNCTLCRNLLAQTEKQLKLILSSLRLQLNLWNLKHNIFKQMHDQKTNIHEHINNIHRETTPAMRLNQRLSSINSKTSVHGCSSQILCLFSLRAPEWMILNYFTMYKWGCLYPFSLSDSKTV